MDLEINKIVAAVLMVALLVLVLKTFIVFYVGVEQVFSTKSDLSSETTEEKIDICPHGIGDLPMEFLKMCSLSFNCKRRKIISDLLYIMLLATSWSCK